MKIFAVDNDGTLLRDDKTYHEGMFKRVIEECKRKGIAYVVASGNQYYQLKRFFPDYDDLYFVAENGTIVFYHDEILEKNTLSEMEFILALEDLKTYVDEHICVCGVKSAYVLNQEDYDHFKKYYERLEIVSDFERLDDQILKLTINLPEDNAYELVEEMDLSFVESVATTSGSIDFFLEDVSKCSGIECVCRKLGCSMSDVVAFGDSDNDVEMLEAAGDSYAMAKASLKAKAAAKHQLGSNNDDAVLRKIGELLGLNFDEFQN